MKTTMKRVIMLMAMLLVVMAAAAKSGKGLKTIVFTTLPVMHCENCENKIKGNLRFEKGVKDIETNVDQQRVVVTYDPVKTTETKLQKAFKKIGYEATVVTGAVSQDSDCCKEGGKDAAAQCKSGGNCGGCKKKQAKASCDGQTAEEGALAQCKSAGNCVGCKKKQTKALCGPEKAGERCAATASK